MNTTTNQYRFKMWFPGLEEEKPAQVLWSAPNAEEAYRQITEQYPDCSILCCVD